ncbi:ABC transporter substrate-binding protein [Nesterenkonia sp. CL21]|uniref:peptide ABC transporter substrate-binding protein n=1 Tax=Nesterenkonia sp. CL21 TaxID=3064894 RepID=UPI0028787C75|nr:ABC transporter substrate-binding protein [Nesterenkonia sp. CL21]MDS2171236.1 ABC transporter substrate-binding protein [Nesterenkonia sp. CL21]
MNNPEPNVQPPPTALSASDQRSQPTPSPTPARGRLFAGAGLSTALLLTACAEGGGGEDASADGGEFTAYTCEPQSLTPGNTSEVCGARVLEQLFTGLTEIDYDTFEATEGVAESWESEDNITWTFHLRDDYAFHDGEEIDAHTFVDTFTWTADESNAQVNSEFYEIIAGYDELQDDDVDELSGVRAIDDHTLEIELSDPFGQLPVHLGLLGFSPIPSAAYEDMDAFEQAPIGNGRYRMDGEWVHDEQIAVTRHEDWPGEVPGNAERIEWRIYSDVGTAYMDVQAGQLDLLEQAPPEQIPNMEADFGENQGAFETGTFTYLGFPLYQEDFQDPDVRRALSMAIDRDSIVETIFDGGMQPARSIIPPVLPEGREDACDACEYDPETAADLYEAAGGPSEMEIYYNSGAGHDDWVEAVTNQWQQHLGIEDITFRSLDFAQYLDDLAEENASGPFRLGWTLSSPSAQYAMEPIYSTGASRNYAGYSSEEFDSLIQQANAADVEDAEPLYHEVEDVLLEDLPVIPLWFNQQHVVHTDRITDVEVSPRGLPRVESITVTE